jgi:hypothetical protein
MSHIKPCIKTEDMFFWKCECEKKDEEIKELQFDIKVLRISIIITIILVGISFLFK